MSGRLNRVMVTLAGKDHVHGLSMSRHLLIRVRVYLRSKMALFDSRAISNAMYRKTVDKLHIRIMPTTRRIKVANCAFEKCVGYLRDVPIQMGELVVPLEFSVIESSLHDVIVGLLRMIKLRAMLEHYRMVLKLHFEGDSEILNYEYEREVGHTSEHEFTSNDVGESNKDDDSEKGLALMLSDGKTNAPDCEEEELINQKLCHLNQTATEGIKSILSKYREVIALFI